jgi:carbohydrate-binding DOMON domain-containing protein
MATQRYISTSFWDDEWIMSLDPSEKFVYLYLMTNTLTNIAGVYKISNRRICFDTGYNDDTINKILERYAEAEKAFRYEQYIIIPSWPKHQKWESKSKIQAGIESIIKELPKELVKFLVKIQYRYPIIPYIYDANYLDLDLDLDLNKDLDSDIDGIRLFENFKNKIKKDKK